MAKNKSDTAGVVTREEPDGSTVTVIQAHGGDRLTNLERIGESLQKAGKNLAESYDSAEGRRIAGYGTQILICVDDLRKQLGQPGPSRRERSARKRQ